LLTSGWIGVELLSPPKIACAHGGRFDGHGPGRLSLGAHGSGVKQIVELAAIPLDLGIRLAGQLPGLVITKQPDRYLPILHPAPIAQPVGRWYRQAADVEELDRVVKLKYCLDQLAAPELRQLVQ